MLPLPVTEALVKADRQQIELAGIGCFSQVIKVAETGPVIKETFDHPVVGNLQSLEKRIYERLGHHPYILRYYGEYGLGSGLPNGLVFQYYGLGTLADNLALSKYATERTQWPIQAAEALHFIHSKNVFHSDFGSHNFLIQKDGSLVRADFGGSRIDDTPAVVSYSTRYARPGCNDDVSREVDDIFALGTLLYMIGVGHALYAEQPSREVRKLSHMHKFPALDGVPPSVQRVIEKCWSNGYLAGEEIIFDLKETSSHP